VARTRTTVSATPVGDVELTVVTPVGSRRSDPLPLLLAHDGPEYSRRAHLLLGLRTATAAGRVPPTRVVLLEPGPRNERYAANPLWAEALTGHVLPTVRAAYAVAGSPTLMGASLGALASLQAEWRRPGTFGALFLQSGSFFRRRLDDEEDFEYWDRVTAFVNSVRRTRRRRTSARIVLTCGTEEGNLANNRLLAQSLRASGHDVTLVERPGGHDWPSWERAFDPPLLDLLARRGGRPAATGGRVPARIAVDDPPRR
jgi:enterochelin esterase family protein